MASPAVFGGGQIGFKSETTWGTIVTPDKFVGFLPPETLKATQNYIKDESVRGSRKTLVFQKRGSKIVGGDINLNLPNVTMATLLHHMFGTIATTGAGPYTHTASPGSLLSQSLTIQKGVPDSTGTIQPFTYSGCKIADWEITAALNELVKLKLTVTAKDETTATSLATASYASGYNPFSFVEASAELPSGTAFPVHSFSLKGTNALKTDHLHLGTRNISEQYDNGRFQYTGSFNIDFTGLTDYNRIVNGTLVALKLILNNADGGGSDTLTFTINARLTGDAPTMANVEAVAYDYNFEAESATSDANAITAVLVNTDASSA